MAKVGQVFQANVFQTNSFQGEWGAPAFQKNVFQNNVYDVPTTIKKIVTEALSVAETQVRTRELLRLVNDSVTVEQFKTRIRSLVYHVA